MHKAPPVSLRAGGGPFWRSLPIGLPALVAAVLAAWSGAHLDWPRAGAAVGLAIGLVGGMAAWHRPSPTAQLSWDGQHWSVDGRVGALDVMIDLQRWLLLRLRPADGSPERWVAVAGTEAGARMPVLRTVLHAAPHGGDDVAGGAAAVRPPHLDR